jgi:hypothetical protein
MCLPGSSGPLLRLHAGFSPGRGGVAAINMLPALTTPNVVCRLALANAGWLFLFHRHLLSIAPVRRLPRNFPELRDFWEISWIRGSSC